MTGLPAPLALDALLLAVVLAALRSQAGFFICKAFSKVHTWIVGLEKYEKGQWADQK